MTVTVIKSYGRWLTWLDRNGLLDVKAAPAERVMRVDVERFTEELKILNAPQTVRNRILNLYFAISAMSPDRDWAWLLVATRQLRKAVVPARDKHSRIVESDQLFRLGVELMDAAETQSPSRQSAGHYRDGLMISFLALRPLRRGNLTGMDIGTHLLKRNGRYFIHFDGRETKNGQDIDTNLPDILAPRLECYLATYRPVLLGRRVKARHPNAVKRERRNALWISAYGRAMSEGAIYCRLINATTARFGHGINPHLFRDCAATTIGRRDCAHVNNIKCVLGHSTIKTSERHYNHARSLQASRQFSHILELRRKDQRCAEKKQKK